MESVPHFDKLPKPAKLASFVVVSGHNQPF